MGSRRWHWGSVSSFEEVGQQLVSDESISRQGRFQQRGHPSLEIVFCMRRLSLCIPHSTGNVTMKILTKITDSHWANIPSKDSQGNQQTPCITGSRLLLALRCAS